MTSLQGSELVDCARANGAKGIEVAAQRCGYENITAFETALRKASEHLGIEIQSFDVLIRPADQEAEGVEVSPETSSQL